MITDHALVTLEEDGNVTNVFPWNTVKSIEADKSHSEKFRLITYKKK